MGHTGGLNDSTLGLTYMQARYYDPVIGRFYSNDPVGFKSSNIHSFGRYTYGNNNPYKYVDPDGNEAKSFFLENKTYDNLGQALSGAWGDLLTSMDTDVKSQSREVSRVTKQGSVKALRVTSTVTDAAGKGALAASIVFPPAAEAGLVLTGISLATGVTADLIEGQSSGEQFESALPAVVGQTTTTALKALKVPAPMAEHVGNRVEAIGTAIESAGDLKEDK